MNWLINFLDKAYCACGFHVWSSPFVQRYQTSFNGATAPDDMVCICTREGCKGKQLFLHGKWVTIQ